jgi:hypothetical protein
MINMFNLIKKKIMHFNCQEKKVKETFSKKIKNKK